MPYLFTQCEDIACRSVAPMMDTPSIKITYDAKVTVKEGFKVHMSANSTDTVALNDNKTQFHFNSSIPMPSYLIALAVGDLAVKKIGNRTSVITEPINLEAVATELD
mmetsp:Transcript_38215/g.58291  ORF Transcript_38215/g.58291 Transcript_38215/m.58291 type:complete len:107 (+) Transcript_38215:485-805(+)